MLFRYELKKLLGRKMVWIALALALAALVLGNISLITEKTSGRVQGFRDVYDRYEGQVLTDAVAAQAQDELDAYIAAHPDEFMAWPTNEDDRNEYSPKDVNYSKGVYDALSDIARGETVEKLRQMRESWADMLKTGLDEKGNPLTEDTRQYFADELQAEWASPVIRYAEGYKVFELNGQYTGVIILGLLTLTLPVLFAGEESARMEPILLCAAGRRRAARAKLAAALAWAWGLWGLIMGGEVLLVGLTYGLDGLGVSGYSFYLTGIRWPIAVGYSLLGCLGLLLMASLASAGLAAFCSAVFRPPLTALLGGAAAAGGQVMILQMATGRFNWMDFSIQSRILRKILTLLPASALWEGSGLFMSVDQIDFFAIGLGISALALGLALWLAPRRWLRARRA